MFRLTILLFQLYFIFLLIKKSLNSKVFGRISKPTPDDSKNTIYNVLYPNSTLTLNSNHEYSHGECLNNYNCFLPYGICLNSTTCMCMPEFANIYIEGHSVKELSCSYKRKRVLIAVMLEIFLPLGLGHFYVGHYTLGTAKFFYNFFLYLLCCTMYYKGTSDEIFTRMLFICIILSCVLPIWNIIDLFLFFTNAYKDGYGVALS